MGSIITVIFPSDADHPVAQMTRLDLENASGVKIDHGYPIIDYALSLNTEDAIIHERVTFTGQATIWRENREKLQSYLVRKGSHFSYTSSPKIGFESTSPISVNFEDRKGQIISSGTNVTFFYPDLEGIQLNEQLVTPVDQGDGWITIQVEKGNHQFTLQSDYTEVRRENVNESGQPRRPILLQNYPNPFNNETIIPFHLSVSGHVRLTILNQKGQEVERLIDTHQRAGDFHIRWNAKGLPRGIYLVRLQASGWADTKKLILQ
jgi:hypothetical protein